MSKLLEKLRKNTVVDACLLSKSKYFNDGTFVTTRIPLLNLALSGKLDGGLPKGIVQIAAPPKHFKTNFMIEIIKGFQLAHKGKDYVVVFYDSELGSTPAYFAQAGIDTDRIDHRPVCSVEELRSDAANLLSDSAFGDLILICIDSIGMLRSDKETADAKSESDAADMTRARQLKSFFRIVTNEAALKQIPMVVVNHSYTTMDKFAKEVAAGGRGAQYAAHTLLFITKAQEKEKEDGKDTLAGFRFTLRAALSRYVRENATFPISVSFDDGIDRYSGIFDLALQLDFITSPVKGWYLISGNDARQRRSNIEENVDYMEGLLANPEFTSKVEALYKFGGAV